MEATYDQVKNAVSAGKVRELIAHTAQLRDESGARMAGHYYVAQWTEPDGIRLRCKLSPIQKAELENEFGISARDLATTTSSHIDDDYVVATEVKGGKRPDKRLAALSHKRRRKQRRPQRPGRDEVIAQRIDCDAGQWLRPVLSVETRDALATFEPIELYTLLCLDDYPTKGQRALLVRQAKTFKENAARCEALASRVRQVHDELLSEVKRAPHRWSVALGVPRKHGKITNFALALTAVETAARAIANQERRAVESCQKRAPRHDSKGIRASVPKIRKKLCEMRERLSSDLQGMWTVQKIARLIIASANDWTTQPCPDLARRAPTALIGWLEQHLSRANRRRS